MDRGHLKEYFSASDDKLHFQDGINTRNDFVTPFKAGPSGLQYHIDVVRTQLTQNLAKMMPHIADELAHALTDELEPLLTDGKSELNPTSQYVRLDCCSRLQFGFETCFENNLSSFHWTAFVYSFLEIHN